MYKGIPDKKTSFALYESGAFGNKLRSWSSYHKLCLDNYGGTVTIRYLELGSKRCTYNVPQHRLSDLINEWQNEGVDLYKIKFNESAPDDHLIIQGEIQEHYQHKYVLSCSFDKVPMREAMHHPKSLLGNEAIWLLQEHFSKESMRNLSRLFATYPKAIVEFSTYDHMLGEIPNNNTIFWEVRNY